MISHSLPASRPWKLGERKDVPPSPTLLSPLFKSQNSLTNQTQFKISKKQSSSILNPELEERLWYTPAPLAASKDVCSNPIQFHACVCLPFPIARHANVFPLYPLGIQFMSPPANLSTVPHDLGKQSAESMRAGYTSPKAGRRKRNAVRRNLFGNQGEVVDE